MIPCPCLRALALQACGVPQRWEAGFARGTHAWLLDALHTQVSSPVPHTVQPWGRMPDAARRAHMWQGVCGRVYVGGSMPARQIL